MTPVEQRFTKRAIANYGIELGHEVVWFIDEGKVFYGKKNGNGEIGDYLSGYISGNVFVIEYSSDQRKLDISGWDDFITNHLELGYIDAQ